LHGSLEGAEAAAAVVRMLMASAVLAGAAWFVWWGLDGALGRSLVAQIVTVGTGIATGTAFYVALVLHWRIPEAQQIYGLVAGRLGGRFRRRRPPRRVPPPRRRAPRQPPRGRGPRRRP